MVYITLREAYILRHSELTWINKNILSHFSYVKLNKSMLSFEAVSGFGFVIKVSVSPFNFLKSDPKVPKDHIDKFSL